MTNLIHCDGPGCDKTRDPDQGRRLCDAPWLTVESEGMEDHHFHAKPCLAAWAGTPTPTFARGAIVTEPTMAARRAGEDR